jgi:hypothetical protein
MKKNLMVKFNFITNILIILLLFFGSVIWADSNGIFINSKDIVAGTFGGDEGNGDFTFMNNLEIKGNLKTPIIDKIQGDIITTKSNLIDKIDTTKNNLISKINGVKNSLTDSINAIKTQNYGYKYSCQDRTLGKYKLLNSGEFYRCEITGTRSTYENKTNWTEKWGMNCGANTNSNYVNRANELGLSCPSGYRSRGISCKPDHTWKYMAGYTYDDEYWTIYTLRCIPYSTIDYGWVKK